MKFNLLVLLAAMLMSQFALSTDRMCMPDRHNPVTLGGETWPWGRELPFPWREIEGVWMAKIGDCSTYYTFKTLKTLDSEKVLQIHEIDPASCRLISKGAGYEDGRVVMAVMNGKSGPYNMEVHSFRESDVRELKDQESSVLANDRVLTVMTVSPLSAPSQKATSQLYKISSDPDDVCNE